MMNRKPPLLRSGCPLAERAQPTPLPACLVNTVARIFSCSALRAPFGRAPRLAEKPAPEMYDDRPALRMPALPPPGVTPATPPFVRPSRK